MKRTNIYLEERQTTALDEVARRTGITRAEVVRRYVDRGLGEDVDSVEDDLAAFDTTFGVLSGGDGEGQPTERDDGARQKDLRRLWAR